MSDEHPTKCAVCSKLTLQSCGNCKKSYYCGKEHQKSHRKVHKEDCFPACLTNDSESGQHWVATRDIQEGEIIFKEYPIAVGPCGSLPQFHLLCLGCFKYLAIFRPCSKCGWPTCSDECENNDLHARLECPILTRTHVNPPNLPVQYLYIFIIRCLLLRENDPKSWELIMTLESHMNARKAKNPEVWEEKSQSLYNFIRRSCKLEMFDENSINQVWGAIQFNSYGLERLMKGSGVGVQLYYKLGKVNHSCIPNTESVDIDPRPGQSAVSRGLSINSTVFIPKGHPLLQRYGETLQGTYDRQRFLESEYMFTCKCERCSDPTELGTFYSAVKCKSSKCRKSSDLNSGYLLPLNPLDINSLWKCSNTSTCKATHPYDPDISKIIGAVTEDLKLVFEKVRKGCRNLAEQIELNSALENFLKKHEGITVHPHHFTLIPVKMRHFQEITEILTNMKETDPNFISKFEDKILNEMRDARSLLNVFTVLSPGNSSSRGFLLKCLEDFEQCLKISN